MPNPLFNALGGSNGMQAPTGMSNMLQAFQQFRASFSGDPKQQVQQLLNSGRMSQDQFNQLSQMANNLMQYIR